MPSPVSALVTNPEEVHPLVLPELDSAIDRAISAGAQPPVTYFGAGMTSIVFCDANNVAWKVARRPDSPTLYRLLEDESEWLDTASLIPEVARHVVPFRAWHPDQVIIERECIHGVPGGWAGGKRFDDVQKLFETEMAKAGWTAPEYKRDSYVLDDESKQLILVDAGFVYRLGDNLVQYITEILAGQRRYPPSFRDLAFDLQIAVQYKEIEKKVANELLAAMDQELIK